MNFSSYFSRSRGTVTSVIFKKAKSPEVEQELIKKESLQEQALETTEDQWKQKGKNTSIGGSLPLRKDSAKKLKWINDETDSKRNKRMLKKKKPNNKPNRN